MRISKIEVTAPRVGALKTSFFSSPNVISLAMALAAGLLNGNSVYRGIMDHNQLLFTVGVIGLFICVANMVLVLARVVISKAIEDLFVEYAVMKHKGLMPSVRITEMDAPDDQQ